MPPSPCHDERRCRPATNARCGATAVGLVPGAAASMCAAGDERYGRGRPRGSPVARRRKVHRSTHVAASACLLTPPHASRRLCRIQSRVKRLRPVSPVHGHESAFCSQVPAHHGALFRNEGAVGSDPITSTTRTARKRRFRAVLCFGEVFVRAFPRACFLRRVAARGPLSVGSVAEPGRDARLCFGHLPSDPLLRNVVTYLQWGG